MREFFRIEGPFFTFLGWLGDMIMLNFIFLLCCIPVITLGASFTALSSVTRKISRREEGSIIKDFFASFRQNFKQATVIWLLFAVLGAGLIFNIRLPAGPGGEGVLTAVKTLSGFLLIVYALTITYAFPLLARFDNTVLNTLKNAFLLSVRFLPRTILLMVLNLFPVILVIFYTAFLPFFLLAGPSVISYLSAGIFNKILDPLTESGQDVQDTEK